MKFLGEDMKAVSTIAHDDLEWRSDEAEMVSTLLGAFEQIGTERKGFMSIGISPLRLFSRKSEGTIRIGGASSRFPVFMDEDHLETFPFLRRDTSAGSVVASDTSSSSHISHVSPKSWWRRIVGPKAGGPVAS